jgi:tetratricopeptide (TPR) repeat protein
MTQFSAVIMACDEEGALPELERTLSFASEVILLDNPPGSKDRTREVARSLGWQVFDGREAQTNPFTLTQERVDEFTKALGFAPLTPVGTTTYSEQDAKAFGIARASNDWVAMPDCDERIKWDGSEVESLIASGATAIRHRFIGSHNPDGSASVEFVNVKVFDRRFHEWRYRLHALVLPKEGVAHTYGLAERTCIHHWQKPKRAHRKGYFPALECAVAEDIDDARMLYYLGRDYLSNGHPGKAIACLNRYLACNNWVSERAQALQYEGVAWGQLGRDREAVECFHLAMLEEDTRREPFVALADHYMSRGEFRRAVTYLSAAASIPFPEHAPVITDCNLYTTGVAERLAECYAHL